MILTINSFLTNFDTISPFTIYKLKVNDVLIDVGVGSQSFEVEVDDGCPAKIQLDGGYPAFYVYENTITDVGSDNFSIDIVLVPVGEIGDDNYLRPWPSFLVIQNGCDFCVDVYKTSSYVGDISWYVNNEAYREDVHSMSTCFNNVGSYQVKIRTKTSNVDGTPRWDQFFATTIEGNTEVSVVDEASVYLSADVVTNIALVEYRPDLSLAVAIDIEPLKDGEVCCYSQGETVKVTPSYELHRLGADSEPHNMEFTVIDPEGTTMDINPYLFPLGVDDSGVYIDFELDKLGTYLVTATIEDVNCKNYFSESIIIETCNFMVMQYKGCNNYTYQNRSSNTTVTYYIDSISEISDTQSGTLLPGQEINLTFNETSMFIVKASYTRNGLPVEESSIVNNYCQIEECFASYIEDLICPTSPRCSPCPDESDLKQMFLLYNTYFMKVNKLFKQNSFFTALDDSTLVYITTLNQLMEKITHFCKRYGCLTSNSSAFNTSFVVEGPYDWAGQGNNAAKNCACGSTTTTSTSSGCKTCGG